MRSRTPSAGRSVIWIVLLFAFVLTFGLFGFQIYNTVSTRELIDKLRYHKRNHDFIVVPPPNTSPAPSQTPGTTGSAPAAPSNSVSVTASPSATPSMTPSNRPTPPPDGCTFYEEAVCADSVDTSEIYSEIVDTTVIKTQTICADVLEHTQDGELPPNWAVQRLVGTGAEIVPPQPVFPPVDDPLSNTSPGDELPNGQSFTALGSLVVSAVGNGISFQQLDGKQIIQLGEEEEWFVLGNTPLANAPLGTGAPFDLQTSAVKLTVDSSLLPVGAAGVKLDMRVRWSNEVGYDFLYISGSINQQLNGRGTEESPYQEQEFFGVTLLPGSSLDFTYVKDDLVYEGVDAAQIEIYSLTHISYLPPNTFGNAGRNMRLPQDLSEWIGKKVDVCSGDEYVHTVNLTGTGLSFDGAGEYTELSFYGGGPCCVSLLAVTESRMSATVSTSHCAHFCKPYQQSCTSSFNTLTTENIVLRQTFDGVLSPAHSLVQLAGGVTVFIRCDAISEYVGRTFLLTTEGDSGASKIQIAEESGECGAHFQLGDPLLGRQRASVLRLQQDKNAAVQFTVVSETLIAVSMTQHVERCDSTGKCAEVGQQLNPFAGWWTSDGGRHLRVSYLRPQTIFIDDADYQTGSNQLKVTIYIGPIQNMHNPICECTGSTLENIAPAYTRTMYLKSPYEAGLFQAPALFTQMAHVDPADPSTMFIQTFGIGPDPLPELFYNEWHRRDPEFPPYTVFRRVGAPFGAGGSRSGLRPAPTPTPLPLTYPEWQLSTTGFRDMLFHFNYYVDAQLYTYNGGVFNEEPDQRCSGVESFVFADSLRKRILAGETFTKTVSLVGARRTATARGLTSIYVSEYHTVNLFSNVTFSGVSGPWGAQLNGKSFRVSTIQNGIKRHAPGTIDTGSLKYVFYIDLNSTGMPIDDEHTGYVALDGSMTVVHGPLHADAEYKRFMDMVFYFDREVFIESTHHFMAVNAYTSEDSLDRACVFTAETWEQVQTDLDVDPYDIHYYGSADGLDFDAIELSTTQRRNDATYSSFYVNGFNAIHRSIGRYLPLFSFTGFRNLINCARNGQRTYDQDENDPSGELVYPEFSKVDTPAEVLANPLMRHIPFQNYGNQSKWVVPYWRTNGPPGEDILGLEVQASFAYPPYDGTAGDEIIGVIYPHDELPCVNCNFMSFDAPLNGPCQSVSACRNETACTDGLCESYYEYLRDTDPVAYSYWNKHTGCTILRENLSGGHAIGYCFFRDTSFSDPSELVEARTFAPGNTGSESNPRRMREARVAAFAPLFQYLYGQEDAEAILFDIRGNNGGQKQLPGALSEYFGAERNAVLGNRFNPSGGGQRPRKSFDDMFDPYNFKELLNNEGVRKHFPELSEAFYPGSTRPGTPAFILSDYRATSGGDLFPQWFAGPNLDGDLGAGTVSRLFGNPVATLFGCNGQDGHRLIQTPDSYLLTSKWTGLPISPLHMSLDYSCDTGTYPDQTTPSCAKTPYNFPVMMPALPGLDGGGAPPHSMETLWLPDIGYLNNTRPRLPGDTRPQTPTWPPVTEQDLDERRDAWLEGLIAYTIDFLSAKKRAAPADHSAYYQRVEEWRKKINSDKTKTARRSGDLPLCDPATEVSGANVAKSIVARVVTLDTLTDIPGRTHTRVYDNAGNEIDMDELHVLMHNAWNQVKQNGGLCQHEDGSVGVTDKAGAIPRVEFSHKERQFDTAR